MGHSKLFDLTERRATVIGGGRDIGAGDALALGAHGAEVAVADRDEQLLDEVRAEGVSTHVVDVLAENGIADLAKAVGELEVVVHTRPRVFASRVTLTPTEVHDVLQLNLVSCWETIRHFGPGSRISTPRNPGRSKSPDIPGRCSSGQSPRSGD